MTFGGMFFILGGVWFGAHLFFGFIDGEVLSVIDQFRNNSNPMFWLTPARTIVTFDYSVLSENWFFLIIRSLLILIGTIWYLLVIKMIWQILSFLFSGITSMISGFRRRA